MYNTAKKIYNKIKIVPVLGPIIITLAPIIKHILMPSKKNKLSLYDLSMHDEIIIQSLIALQSSSNSEFTRLNQKLENDISAYRNRIEFIRMEIFEQLQELKFTDKTVKSNFTEKNTIINNKKYDEALEYDTIRLNIGCGHKPLANYLNVDKRNLPNVDIVAEADALPFEKNTVKEIFSSHLLEHFTLIELTKNILPKWYALLEKNGILTTIIPDAESMILAYTAGNMSFSDLLEVTFGAQDYDDDYHQTMFTTSTFKNILIEAGFCNITIMASNRINGKCREMEIKAMK
jgi:predicted SAM-dependent methyltransferase